MPMIIEIQRDDDHTGAREALTHFILRNVITSGMIPGESRVVLGSSHWLGAAELWSGVEYG